MAVSHIKTLTQGDTSDTSVVRPSDWNSGHQIVQNFGGNTQGTSQIAGSDIYWAGGTNITLSANGSTVSIHGEPDINISRLYAAPGATAAGIAGANSLVSIVDVLCPQSLVYSAFAVPVSISVATAANTSSAGHQVSISVVMYTRNGSTLSSINSGSQTFSAFYQSNGTSSYAGVRELSIPWATASTATVGRYYFAVHISSNTFSTGAVASWTSLGQTHSMGVVVGASGFYNMAAFGGNTNATNGLRDALGIISTGATRDSIGIASITGTGNSGAAANLWFDWRNYTI